MVNMYVYTYIYLLHNCYFQLGPNADVKKWQDEQIDIATVTFGARDAKEKSKVSICINVMSSLIYFCHAIVYEITICYIKTID